MRRRRCHLLPPDKPGMGAAYWHHQKRLAELKMAGFDEAPAHVRALARERGLTVAQLGHVPPPKPIIVPPDGERLYRKSRRR